MSEDQTLLFDDSEFKRNQLNLMNSSSIKIIPMKESDVSDTHSLEISYSFGTSPFGELIAASTELGICYLAFHENKNDAVSKLKKRYKGALITEQSVEAHKKVFHFFDKKRTSKESITLHVKGTEFQLQVWNLLLKIPFGELVNYRDLALELGDKNMARAVGTAIGRNPVAYIIPCHRVVPLSGKIGGYMWGSERKKQIIQWERS